MVSSILPFDGNKQLKANIIVLVHASDRAWLEFNPRDTDFSPVDLPDRCNTWIGAAVLGIRRQRTK